MQKSETTLFIHGIDAATSEEEIKEAIMSNVDVTEDQAKIVSIRPARFENKVATTILPKKAALILLKKDKIRIGWVQCQIVERVPIIRCFKCLELGHRAKDCKGEDRATACINCGEIGHQASGCQKPSFCVKCQIRGHRADQTRCPFFRKWLQEERKKRHLKRQVE